MAMICPNPVCEAWAPMSIVGRCLFCNCLLVDEKKRKEKEMDELWKKKFSGK